MTEQNTNPFWKFLKNEYDNYKSQNQKPEGTPSGSYATIIYQDGRFMKVPIMKPVLHEYRFTVNGELKPAYTRASSLERATSNIRRRYMKRFGKCSITDCFMKDKNQKWNRIQL